MKCNSRFETADQQCYYQVEIFYLNIDTPSLSNPTPFHHTVAAAGRSACHRCRSRRPAALPPLPSPHRGSSGSSRPVSMSPLPQPTSSSLPPSLSPPLTVAAAGSSRPVSMSPLPQPTSSSPPSLPPSPLPSPWQQRQQQAGQHVSTAAAQSSSRCSELQSSRASSGAQTTHRLPTLQAVGVRVQRRVLHQLCTHRSSTSVQCNVISHYMAEACL